MSSVGQRDWSRITASESRLSGSSATCRGSIRAAIAADRRATIGMLFFLLAFAYLSLVVNVAEDASLHHGDSQVIGYSLDLGIVFRKAFAIQSNAMLQCRLAHRDDYVKFAADCSLVEFGDHCFTSAIDLSTISLANSFMRAMLY